MNDRPPILIREDLYAKVSKRKGFDYSTLKNSLSSLSSERSATAVRRICVKNAREATAQQLARMVLSSDSAPQALVSAARPAIKSIMPSKRFPSDQEMLDAVAELIGTELPE